MKKSTVAEPCDSESRSDAASPRPSRPRARGARNESAALRRARRACAALLHHLIADREDGELELAGGAADDHLVAGALAEQCAADRRAPRDAPARAVTLVLAHDGVGDLRAVLVLELDRGPEEGLVALLFGGVHHD